MDHASEFVYIYDTSDTEEIDADEADVEEHPPIPPPVPRSLRRLPSLSEDPAAPPRPPPPPPPRVTKRVRQADSNIVAFKFCKLVDPSHMHTGDPEACAGCGALLSHLSELQDAAGVGAVAGDDKSWRCEFCGHENLLKSFSEEQKPKDEDVTYMDGSASSEQESRRTAFSESVVVFCVDVSGSMGSTVQAPGGRYISRLEGVQMAIDQQLTKLAREHPRRRVCIVTFESSVHVLGDCSSSSVILSCSYSNALAVMNDAKRFNLLRTVGEAVDAMREKVRHLRTLGSTALGPGLAAALGIAMQTNGSQVIMCTDGLANVGVGSLEGAQQERAAESFYNEMKDIAKQHGVSISVISIEGSECRLGQLGILADATGGQVNIVNPLRLRDEFRSILENRILATNVRATLFLHRGLYVRHEPAMTNVVTREVGAVTADQEITFEYGVNRGQSVVVATAPTEAGAAGSAAGSAEDMSEEQSRVRNPVDELEWLPFQLQLRYTAADGVQAVRVLTQRRRVTRDRSQAEQYVNVRVVATHAVQQTARLAEEGLYDTSHYYNVGMSRKLKGWASESPEDDDVYARYDGYCAGFRKNVRREAKSRPPAPPSYAVATHRTAPVPSLATASDEAANAVYQAKRKTFF